MKIFSRKPKDPQLERQRELNRLEKKRLANKQAEAKIEERRARTKVREQKGGAGITIVFYDEKPRKKPQVARTQRKPRRKGRK